MAHEVANPRRILAVGPESSAHHIARLIQDLTGTAPDSAGPLAGTTHDLALETGYYRATIPIWLDLIASPAEWAASFLSDEARQVLDVLGGFVLIFALPSGSSGTAPHTHTDGGQGKGPDTHAEPEDLRGLLRHVGSVVRDGLGGWEWDGVRLAVGVGEGEADEWEELCAAAGLEYVQLPAQRFNAGDPQSGFDGSQLNGFGEKTGVARIREALEANDWELEPSTLDEFGHLEAGVEHDDDDDDDNGGTLGFGIDDSDLQSLRKAIWDSGPGGDAPTDDAAEAEAEAAADENGNLGDEDVAKVERMVRRLQAAREMGEGMGEAQRRRLAARAVKEVMQDL
ncbi:Increased recombination centers protein 6 [Escovopsis weberi]|uniref:Increased recombination centers protein 6 n=1 Tax=Escovopsis weberi TaxID=150374 RepID=A0A0M9VRZ7_ESCWE|nr:Increased recombination centers protein 6 [Escovopsis weberi]